MKFYESIMKAQQKQNPPQRPPSFLPQQLQPPGAAPSAPQQQSAFKDASNSSPLRQSVYLKNKPEENEESWFKKLCACTQLQYYQDYFKVTNDQVKMRILNNLKFWDGGFFNPIDQNYDFYGPFWIYTTVVFCLGAVHNILQYQANPESPYNYQIIGEAFFIMYVLGFGLPIGIAFIMKFLDLGVTVTVIQIICLYGYSMPIYIICIGLCSIDFCLLHWIFLGYGAVNKIYFVFKNIHEGFEIPISKQMLMTVLIIIEGALQFLIFKFRFIQCADHVESSSSTESHLAVDHELKSHLFSGNYGGNFMHYRNFADF